MAKRKSHTTWKRKLDKLVGEHCRSKGKCEACNYQMSSTSKIVQCSTQLQWCHIKSRRYLSVRWSLNNCFCLCAAHHRWFTDNPDEFASFCWDRHPEKMEALQEEFKPIHPMRNADLAELYNKLKQDLT